MCSANSYSPLRMLVTCAIAIACGSSSALSNEIYSYTGRDYSVNQCSGTYVATCTSDHLTGSFVTTLSLTQLENLTSYAMPVSDIASISFSDGTGLTLSQGNATVSVGITTNSSGNILWWEILLRGTDGSSVVDTYNCLPSTCPVPATGGFDFSESSGGSGGTDFESGGQIWSGPAPEASGGFLVGLGLAILAALRLFRRQFRPTLRRS